jgi:hypothetical protein
MSFTIHQVPAAGSSLHSPLWHVIESSNVALDNFRYVFYLYYYDGVGYQPITTCKIVPDGDNGIIDVAPLVRNYLNNYYLPDLAAPVLFDTDEIKVGYSIFYHEEYTVAGVPVDNYLDDATYEAWNGYAEFQPGANTYLPYEGHSQVLTDRNTEISAERDQPIYIPLLNDATGFSLRIKEMDEDGTVLATSSDDSLTGISSSLIQLDISVASINASASLTNFLPVDVALYAVQFIQLGAVYAEYRVRPTCPKDTTKHLVFLNRFGGYESMHFTGVNREEVSMMRKSFTRKPFNTTSNIVRDYNPTTQVYSAGHIDYAVMQQQSYKLQTNWLNDVDHQWLKQLVASTEIYLLVPAEDSSDPPFQYPVKIKTDKWMERRTLVDKMYKLEIEIETRAIQSQYR